MHASVAGWLAVALTVLLLVVSGAVAAPLQPPYDVYEAGPLDAATLGHVADDPGPWKVLHREEQGAGTWLLLALPDGAAGADLPGWGRPRYLGRVRAGERILFLAPDVTSRERLRSGRPLTIAPSNGTVLVSSAPAHELSGRMSHSFRILERPVQLRAPRPPGPPEGMRSSLERARAAGEGGALRTADDVANLIDQVRADSLEVYVKQLSEPGGIPTSRYYADIRTEGVHRDYIRLKFRSALGDANVREHAFRMQHPDGDSITVHNIVGVLPSSVPNAGAFLLTAHYDAIGKRSDPLDLCDAGLRDPWTGCDCTAAPITIEANPACAWNWETDPAPGADDNATGVAALIEAARLLAPLSFDFDLYFVAFQGEELGLLGSAAFADSVAAGGQEVYGVLNVDMLGYNALRHADVVTNEGSEWLADFIVETSEAFVGNLPVQKHVVFFGRSDHASFWSQGIDAVLLFEDINLPYPGYHTFQDLWDTIFPPEGTNSDQLRLSVQLATGTLARFAIHHETPDLALPAGQLQAVGPGGRFTVGRSAVLTAYVHNFGTSYLTFGGSTLDSLSARITFYDGDPQAGAPVIGQVDRRDFFPAGGTVPVQVTWTPAEGSEGFHEIHAVVAGLDPGYAQLEVTSANNEASTSLFVQAPAGTAPELLVHYPYPNPVANVSDAFQLYFELTRDAPRVRVDVFDLEGQTVGYFLATGPFIGDGNQAGANNVPGSDFRWESSDLASGVYVYSIRCFADDGGLADTGEGKFAVVR